MRTLPLTALVALAPSFAVAQAVTYTVDLTANSPTYDRRGGSNLTFPYEAISFTVTDGQNFYMTASGGTHPDAYMYVYSTFDPSNPTSGVILSDDDSGVGLLPSIAGSPLANGDYIAVITAFSGGDYGTLIFDIFGITLNIGPSVAAMGEDLSLQYGRYMQAAAATRGRAISTAVREAANGSTLSASTMGTDDIAWGPAMRSGWATASYLGLNGDVSGHFSQFQAGIDQNLQSGGILGVSLAYDSIATATASSSAKGRTVTLQPYFGTKIGAVDAVFAFAYGVTDFSDYTSGSTTGTAKAKSYELSAHFERTLDMGDGKSIRPFVDAAIGRATMTFDGGLLGAPAAAFNTRRATIGVEVAQALTAGGLQAGSKVYGRIELNHASNTGPDMSFALATPTDKANSAGLAIGSNLVLKDNANFRIEAVANGIGQGKPNVGLSGSLSIKF